MVYLYETHRPRQTARHGSVNPPPTILTCKTGDAIGAADVPAAEFFATELGAVVVGTSIRWMELERIRIHTGSHGDICRVAGW